jgi:hypothetical protein
MTKSEEDLKSFYMKRIEAEANALGHAPERKTSRRMSVDFLAGLAAVALAASCAYIAPSNANQGFEKAAFDLSHMRIEREKIMEFARALGSPFDSRR